MRYWLAAAPSPAGPIGGDAAQRAARTELSRPGYHHSGPSPLDRFTHWIGRLLDHLFAGAGASHAFLLVVLVLLIAVVLVAVRAGIPGRHDRSEVPDTDDPLAAQDAGEHRRIAAVLEAEGRRAEAVREWLRAVIATIEERGILPPRPGRTGARTATEARPLLPSAGTVLAEAMQAFDEVWFGGREATDADVTLARAAADAVRTGRARADPSAAPPAGIAAPW